MTRGHTESPPPEAAPRRVARAPGTFDSLRGADYRYLWIGNLFNTAGMWVQQVTIGWLVWEMSKSPFLVGLVGGLRTLPFLFMGPIGGVAADRVNRKLLLIVTQLSLAAMAAVFAVVVALDLVRVWHAMLFTLVTGCAFAFIQPVRQALVANTVPRRDLGNAIALNAMAGNVTRVVGPAAGGVLIVTFGAAGNFGIQAALFVCMVATVFPMHARYREASVSTDRSAVRNLKEGFTYVLGQKQILGLLVLICVAALFISSLIQILPVFTEDVLHSGANVYGYLVSVYGVGGLIATLILASLGPSTRNGWLCIASLVVSCVLAVAFATSTALPVALALMAAIGFSQMTFWVTDNTLVQTMSPDGLRGRVMSIYHLHDALIPLGSFVIGIGAQVWSSPVAMGAFGVAGLVVTVALMMTVGWMRDVRRVRV